MSVGTHPTAAVTEIHMKISDQVRDAQCRSTPRTNKRHKYPKPRAVLAIHLVMRHRIVREIHAESVGKSTTFCNESAYTASSNVKDAIQPIRCEKLVNEFPNSQRPSYASQNINPPSTAYPAALAKVAQNRAAKIKVDLFAAQYVVSPVLVLLLDAADAGTVEEGFGMEIRMTLSERGPAGADADAP